MLLANIIGLVLQLLGAAVTGWGFRPVWRRAATAGEGLLDPATAFARRVWRRLINTVLRWIGRTPPPQTVAVSGIASMGVVGSARLGKSYPPLSADLDVDAKLAELDRRSQALAADVGRIDSRLFDGLEAQVRSGYDLSQKFDRYASTQAILARKRDIHDIRVGAAGLALVALGTIVQLAGLFIPLEDAVLPHQLCAQQTGPSLLYSRSVEFAGANSRGPRLPLCPGEAQDRTA